MMPPNMPMPPMNPPPMMAMRQSHHDTQLHQRPPPPQYTPPAITHRALPQSQPVLQPQPRSQPQLSQPATAISTTQANQEWAQHTHEGRVFYHNSVTGISTYDRPACLGVGVSGQTGSQQQQQPQHQSYQHLQLQQQQNQQPKAWKIYTDEKSGKKYYSDGVTTTWTRPPDLPQETHVTNTTSVSTKSTPASTTNAPSIKKRKRESHQSSSIYSSKSEAIAAFKGLLLAKNIQPQTKWNDVLKSCQSDSRWDALDTAGERKQALAEYQTKRSNELRELKREEIRRGKEAYNRLLKELLEDNNNFVDSTRYEDIRETISKDDRFHAIKEEELRQELFYEYLRERDKREERSKRLKKQQVKDAFLSILQSHEEKGTLSHASTWNSFFSTLSDEEKSHPNFANIPESDRQLFFADYVLHLQSTEEEKRRRITEARQRAEKAQRDAFRTYLRELANTGMIRPNTRWSMIRDRVGRHATHGPVYAQRREAPRELFEDFVEEWNEEWRRDRGVLLRILMGGGTANSNATKNHGKDGVKNDKHTKVIDESKMSYEEFQKHLLEMATPHPDLYAEVRRILNKEDTTTVSSCRLLYEERRGVRIEDFNSSGKLVEGEESSEDEGEIFEE